MDIVVNFLLDYFVWVLVVLIILLITVIGFLIDTNRKKKLRNSVDNSSASTSNNGSATVTEFTNANSLDAINNMNNMGNVNNMNNLNNMNGVNNLNLSGMNAFGINDVNNMNNMNNMNGVNDVSASLDINNVAPVDNGFDNANMMASMNNMVNSVMNNDPASEVNMANQMMDMNNMNLNDNTNNGVNQGVGVGMTNPADDKFFVPASEQTPKIEPRNVVIPKPVDVTPLPGSTPSPVVEPVAVAPTQVGSAPLGDGGMVNQVAETMGQAVPPVNNIVTPSMDGGNVMPQAPVSPSPVVDFNSMNSAPVSNVAPMGMAGSEPAPSPMQPNTFGGINFTSNGNVGNNQGM